MGRRAKGRAPTEGEDPIAAASAAYLRKMLWSDEILEEAARIYSWLYPRTDIHSKKYAENKLATLRSYVRAKNPVQPQARDAWQLACVLQSLPAPFTPNPENQPWDSDRSELLYPWMWGPLMLFVTGRFERFVDVAVRLFPLLGRDRAHKFIEFCRLEEPPNSAWTWEGREMTAAETYFRHSGIGAVARDPAVVTAELAASHFADGPQVQREIILTALRIWVKRSTPIRQLSLFASR